MQASCGDVPTSTAAAAAAVSTATDLSAPTSQVSQSNSSTTLMAVLLVLIQAPAGTAASHFGRRQSASATEEQIKTRQSRRQQDFAPTPRFAVAYMIRSWAYGLLHQPRPSRLTAPPGWIADWQFHSYTDT